ncbi:MAG: FAD-dependent oxidoreductase [Devosia sp.]
MTAGMVIVGAGECGVRAAMALRENGYAGTVTLVGAEIHPPYERPPLSKQMMLSGETPVPKSIASLARLVEAGITTMLGTTVIAIDREARTIALTDGAVVPYERLLLATGASPRKLPMEGADGPHFVYLRTFEDALRIRQHLQPGQHIVIIGGGFIGLELAASARQRGAEVTVIEALPRLLSRAVPEAIANDLQARHAAEGVSILTGQAIETLHGDGSRAVVTLKGGAKVEADLVLIGIGAVPNVALAEAAGLGVSNGIKVNRCLFTSDPQILAAGDCCAFELPVYSGRRVRLESWRNAQDQGNLAARNMLGASEAISAVPWFWSDQYDLSLQIAGLSDEGSTTVRRDLSPRSYILFHLASDGRLVAASGIGTGNAVAKDIRLAEMLIAKSARPEPAMLADPAYKLKGMLAGPLVPTSQVEQ